MAKKKSHKLAHIHIRSDQSLKNLIGRAARKSGMKESAWLRQRVEEAAKRELGK